MDNELRNAEQLVQLYEITNEDLECIKKLKKESDKRMPEMISSWYLWLSSTPEYEEYFSEKNTRERVQELQLKFWNQFFLGEISDEYVEARRKIKIHSSHQHNQQVIIEHHPQLLPKLLGKERL